MPSPENARLAVLIDADNTSPKHAEALLEEVAKYGIPTVKRAYGDWTNSHLSGWMKKVRELAIQPMLQVAHTTGKNSTDSALIIDAMDLLYSGNVDAFALVSSDSDFTSLATRLRASGMTVYGLGLRKTPQPLRRAVDRFIYLEDLDEPGAHQDTESTTRDDDAPEPRRVPELGRLLERAVTASAHDDGWASLSSVANHLIRVEPSFSVKDYGASKLIDVVRGQKNVDVEQLETGTVRVRLVASRPEDSKPARKTASRRSAPKAAPEPPVVEEVTPEPVPEPTPEPRPSPLWSRRWSRRRTSSLSRSRRPRRAAAKKTAAKKSSVTTRTRSRRSVATEEPVEPAAVAEPTPEPTPEPVSTTPTVTTRKRSSRKVQIT